MITLHTFGPAFGLPDPSPFVTKVDLLLKLSGLPFHCRAGGATALRKAPKGKLPYIEDDGTVIADSSLIRRHLEQRHGIDFDRGLSESERGIAWAAEKLCEDHLYWLVVHMRWIDPANFARGPARFFDALPAPARPLVKAMIVRQMRRTLHGQGAGRYDDAERNFLADRALGSLAAILGDKPYLMGAAPCGADAGVFAFVLGILCPHFEGEPRRSAEAHPNLVAYADRLTRQHYPDFARLA